MEPGLDGLIDRLLGCFAAIDSCHLSPSILRAGARTTSDLAQVCREVSCFVKDVGISVVHPVIQPLLTVLHRLCRARSVTSQSLWGERSDGFAAAIRLLSEIIDLVVKDGSSTQKNRLLSDICCGLLIAHRSLGVPMPHVSLDDTSSSLYDETRPDVSRGAVGSRSLPAINVISSALLTRLCSAMDMYSEVLHQVVTAETTVASAHSKDSTTGSSSLSAHSSLENRPWRFQVQLLLDLASEAFQRLLPSTPVADAGLIADTAATDEFPPAFYTALRLVAQIATHACAAPGSPVRLQHDGEPAPETATAATREDRLVLPSSAMLHRARRAEAGAAISVPAALLRMWSALLMHGTLRSIQARGCPTNLQFWLSSEHLQPLWRMVRLLDPSAASALASSLQLVALSTAQAAAASDAVPSSGGDAPPGVPGGASSEAVQSAHRAMLAAFVCAEHIGEAQLPDLVRAAVLSSLAARVPLSTFLLHPIASVRAAAYDVAAGINWAAHARLPIDAAVGVSPAAAALLAADRCGFLRCCAASGTVDADPTVRRACLKAIGSFARAVDGVSASELLVAVVGHCVDEAAAHATALRLTGSLGALASLFAAAALHAPADDASAEAGTNTVAPSRIGVVRVERSTPAADAAAVASSISASLTAACTAATAAAISTDSSLVASPSASAVEVLDAVRRAFHAVPEVRQAACAKLRSMCGTTSSAATSFAAAHSESVDGISDAITEALEALKVATASASAGASALDHEFLPPASSQASPLEWICDAATMTKNDSGDAASRPAAACGSETSLSGSIGGSSRAPVAAFDLEKSRRLLADASTEPAVRSACALQLWRDGRAAGWAADAAAQDAQANLLRTCVRLLRVHEALTEELDSALALASAASKAADVSRTGYDDTSPHASRGAAAGVPGSEDSSSKFRLRESRVDEEDALRRVLRAEVDTVQMAVLTLLHGLLTGSAAARSVTKADSTALLALWRCVVSHRLPAKGRVRAAAALAICGFASTEHAFGEAGSTLSNADIDMIPVSASSSAGSADGRSASSRSGRALPPVPVLASAWNGFPLLRHGSIAAPDGASALAPAVACSKVVSTWYRSPILCSESPTQLTPADLMSAPTLSIASAIMSAATGKPCIFVRHAGIAAASALSEQLCRDAASWPTAGGDDGPAGQNPVAALGLHARSVSLLMRWDAEHGAAHCLTAVATLAALADAACIAVAAAWHSHGTSAALVDAVLAAEPILAAAGDMYSGLLRAGTCSQACQFRADANMMLAASLCGGVLQGVCAPLLASVPSSPAGMLEPGAGATIASAPSLHPRRTVVAALRLLHSLLAHPADTLGRGKSGSDSAADSASRYHRCALDPNHQSMLLEPCCQAAAALLHDGGAVACASAVLTHAADSADSELLGLATAAAQALASHVDLLATQLRIAPAMEVVHREHHESALRPQLVLESVVSSLAPALALSLSGAQAEDLAKTASAADGGSLVLSPPSLVGCLMSAVVSVTGRGRSAVIAALRALQHLFTASAATGSLSVVFNLMQACNLLQPSRGDAMAAAAELPPPHTSDHHHDHHHDGASSLPSLSSLLSHAWLSPHSIIAACAAGRWFDGDVLAATAGLIRAIVQAHAACTATRREPSVVAAAHRERRDIPDEDIMLGLRSFLSFWRAIVLGHSSIALTVSADSEDAAAMGDATAAILAEAAAGRIRAQAVPQLRRMGTAFGSFEAAQAAAADLMTAIVECASHHDDAVVSLLLDGWTQSVTVPADAMSAPSESAAVPSLAASRLMLPSITVTASQAPLVQAIRGQADPRALPAESRGRGDAAGAARGPDTAPSAGLAERNGCIPVTCMLLHSAAAAIRPVPASAAIATEIWLLLRNACDGAVSSLSSESAAVDAFPLAQRHASCTLLHACEAAAHLLSPVRLDAALTPYPASSAAAGSVLFSPAASDPQQAALDSIIQLLQSVLRACASQMAEGRVVESGDARRGSGEEGASNSTVAEDAIIAVASALRLTALATENGLRLTTPPPAGPICRLLAAAHASGCLSPNKAVGMQLAQAFTTALQSGNLLVANGQDAEAAEKALVALALTVADAAAPGSAVLDESGCDIGDNSGHSPSRGLKPAGAACVAAVRPSCPPGPVPSSAADLSQLLLLPSHLLAAPVGSGAAHGNTAVAGSRHARHAGIEGADTKRPAPRGSVLSSITAASSAGEGRWDALTVGSAAAQSVLPSSAKPAFCTDNGASTRRMSSGESLSVGGTGVSGLGSSVVSLPQAVPVAITSPAKALAAASRPAGISRAPSRASISSQRGAAASRYAKNRALETGSGRAGGAGVATDAVASSQALNQDNIGLLSANLSMALLQLQVKLNVRARYTGSNTSTVDSSEVLSALPADRVARRLTAAASDAASSAAACSFALAKCLGRKRDWSTRRTDSALIAVAIRRLAAAMSTACDGLQRVLDSLLAETSGVARGKGYARASMSPAADSAQPLLASGARAAAAYAASSLWSAIVASRAMIQSSPTSPAGDSYSAAGHEWWAVAAACLDWLLAAVTHPEAAQVSAFLHPPAPAASWGGLLQELLETLKCASASLPVTALDGISGAAARGAAPWVVAGVAGHMGGVRPPSSALASLLRLSDDCVAAAVSTAGRHAPKAVRFAGGPLTAASSRPSPLHAAELALLQVAHATSHGGSDEAVVISSGSDASTFLQEADAPLQLLRAVSCILARLAARWGGAVAGAVLTSGARLALDVVVPAWRALQRSPAAVARSVSEGSPFVAACIELAQLMAVAGDAIAPSLAPDWADSGHRLGGLPASPLPEDCCGAAFELAVCCAAAGTPQIPADASSRAESKTGGQHLALAGLELLEVLGRWRAHELWWTTGRAGLVKACEDAFSCSSPDVSAAAAACVRTAAQHSSRVRAALAMHPVLGSLVI